jgi:hypothetical protein
MNLLTLLLNRSIMDLSWFEWTIIWFEININIIFNKYNIFKTCKFLNIKDKKKKMVLRLDLAFINK